MIPQSHFMVVAPIIEERVNGLRALLTSMNDRPGMARRDNSIVPFGELENLHYARFVILDDQTLRDFEEYGAPIPDFAVLLAFLGDCDGPADELLADMVRVAAPGLRQIFSCCQGFTPASDLLAWMKQHSQAAGRELCELGRPHREADPRRSQRFAMSSSNASRIARTNSRATNHSRSVPSSWRIASPY